MKNIFLVVACLICLSTYSQEVSKLLFDKIINTDGLFVEKDGTVYATEGWSGDKIFKITPQGKVNVFATGLKGPIDILKGSDGNFYVSEWNTPQLSRIKPDGKISKFATVKLGAGPMTQDLDGNIYVTHNVNDGSGYISKVTPNGETHIIAQGGELINPGGIDIDSEGNFYISNFNNANIVKIDKKGDQKIIATVPGDKVWRTGHLKIINNEIYVSGLMDHRIYKVSLDGKIRAFAGTGKPRNEVGDAKSIGLFNPNGLFYLKKSKELYFSIAFTKAGFIQKVNLGANSVYRSEYYAGITFRETPYADIKGTRPLSKNKAKRTNHFEFNYDSQARLTSIKYLLGGKLKPFKDRFVRAPFIKIKYIDNDEIRTFYNEFGHRTIVSGDVYEVRIKRNANGDRTSLKFYDVNGKHIENDFKIATYTWKTHLDGTVIEKRYDQNGNLQRNRPGFGYYITKFTYDHRGMLRLMTNLGKKGKSITPDKAGVAHTKIGYDSNSFFIEWLNLDVNKNPKRGMSNIAKIRYTPAPLYEHTSAMFIDSDGKPQITNWGVHFVKYTHDSLGNITSRVFYDINKQPVNATNGVGQIKMEYASNGIYETSRRYFNKNGRAIEVNGTNIHQIKVDLDNHKRPIRKSSFDLNGRIVNDPASGYAIEKYIYNEKGHLVERQFLNKRRAFVDHIAWGIARIVYEYNNDSELRSVKYYNSLGKEKKALWNPRH